MILGIVMCGLTYLFMRKIEDRTQLLILFSLGFLILVFSIFVIGGFEGMPYDVLSLGVFNLAILYFFLKK
ncbi:hypothetical protein LAV79_21180 [Peribacillus butanolivorans]|uniref:YesK family protein n=1 Tax=Peribacillus butanolivorans TaxID=421767 RepID=UPI0030C90652